MLAAWLHNLSPTLMPLYGRVAVRWYGLSYLAGFLIAYLLLRWLAKRGLSLIPTHRVNDAITTLLVGVLVGGRLGYALVYDRQLLVDFTSSPPFWGFLDITRGGMASHGAMVGVALATWRISRGWKKEAGGVEGRSPILHVMDLTALVCPFGIVLGRIANFVNGELLGRIVAMPGKPAPWWAVKFPQELTDGHDSGYILAKTDPQAYLERERALMDLVAPFTRSTDRTIGEAIDRMIAAVQSGSTPNRAELIERLSRLISARHPSQLYSAFAEGVVVAVVLWVVWARPRTPGVVAAWFLMSYGVMRILVEFWRLPDAGLKPILGLSRGQLLSAVMVLTGATLLAVVSRRGGAKLGGWLAPAARPVYAPAP